MRLQDEKDNKIIMEQQEKMKAELEEEERRTRAKEERNRKAQQQDEANKAGVRGNKLKQSKDGATTARKPPPTKRHQAQPSLSSQTALLAEDIAQSVPGDLNNGGELNGKVSPGPSQSTANVQNEQQFRSNSPPVPAAAKKIQPKAAAKRQQGPPVVGGSKTQVNATADYYVTESRLNLASPVRNHLLEKTIYNSNSLS